MSKLVFCLCALAITLASAAESPFFSPDCPTPGSVSDVSLAMKVAGEPSLFGAPSVNANANTYRLIVKPAFGEVPILVIRMVVDRSEGSKAFVFDMLPFRQAVHSTTYVDAAMASEFEKAYRTTDFRPVAYPKTILKNGRQSASVGIRDGNVWVLETVVDGRYFCIDRPAHEGESFRELGRSLLRFAGRDSGAYR